MSNTFLGALGYLAGTLCSELPCQRSSELSTLLADNQLAKLKFPSLTSDRSTFAANYLFSSLLKKLNDNDKKTAEVRRSKAILKWRENECVNSLTNQRLEAVLFNNSSQSYGREISILLMAQDRIRRLLGDFSIEDLQRYCVWGPGSTLDIKRADYVDTKITRRMTSTLLARSYMKPLIEHDFHWMSAICGHPVEGPCSLIKDYFVIEPYSKLTTVSKDFEIDRCIEIQPTANAFLQSGAGRFLRHRLKSWNVFLDNQSHNQEGAFFCPLSKSCTVDLKNASDTQSENLIRFLIPESLLVYMDHIRMTHIDVDGDIVRVQKYCAMGNGFTFELETMIFHAIAWSVCRHLEVSVDTLRVYGDDIVVSVEAYDDLKSIFSFCGLSFNEEKSFRSPPFFESCGKHYFDFFDVTPVYQKCLIDSSAELIRFHNRILRWTLRVGLDVDAVKEFISACHSLYFDFSEFEGLSCVDDIPKQSFRCQGDDGFMVPDELLQLDSNGGYFSYALRKRNSIFRNLDHRAYLSLKIRNQLYNKSEPCKLGLDASLLLDPKGQVTERVDYESYKLSRVYHFD